MNGPESLRPAHVSHAGATGAQADIQSAGAELDAVLRTAARRRLISRPRGDLRFTPREVCTGSGNAASWAAVRCRVPSGAHGRSAASAPVPRPCVPPSWTEACHVKRARGAARIRKAAWPKSCYSVAVRSSWMIASSAWMTSSRSTLDLENRSWRLKAFVGAL